MTGFELHVEDPMPVRIIVVGEGDSRFITASAITALITLDWHKDEIRDVPEELMQVLDKSTEHGTPIAHLLEQYLRSAYDFLDVRLANQDKFPPQDNQVIEEASEFAKEAMKFQRDKSSRAALHEECIDLINACFNTLVQDGVSIYDTFEIMMKKNQRAIDRFNKNGEV